MLSKKCAILSCFKDESKSEYFDTNYLKNKRGKKRSFRTTYGTPLCFFLVGRRHGLEPFKCCLFERFAVIRVGDLDQLVRTLA